MLRRAASVILTLVAVSCLLVAGQNAKFTFGGIQIGYAGTLVVPQVRCEGGVPTPEGPFPCSEGTKRVFGRSEAQLWYPNAPTENVAPLLNGPITFVVNCNMDGQYRGPCWGTFEWDVPGVGVWEGTWTAPVMDLVTYESQVSMVGHGVGGAIEGKQLMFDGSSAPWEWYITGTVRIK